MRFVASCRKLGRQINLARSGKTDQFIIKSIQFNDKGSPKDYGLIKFRLISDYLPPNVYGLRELLLDHLVAIFSKVSRLHVNCYKVCLRSGCHNGVCPPCDYHFCNSPEYVEIGLAHRVDYPHIRIGLTFDKKNVQDKFDCVGSLGSLWEEVTEDGVRKYANVIQVPVGARIECPKVAVTGDCNKVDECGNW